MPDRVALATGAVREVAGAVVSELVLLTVALTLADTVEFPAASNALAVSETAPLVAVVVFQS